MELFIGKVQKICNIRILLLLVAFCIFDVMHAQITRNDLPGIYEGLVLSKNTDEYVEKINLNFRLNEDGTFIISNMHYMTFANGNEVAFLYTSEGRWIYVVDMQDIVFAFSDNDETKLVSVKKKNGKYYGEKDLKKFKKTDTYKTYVKPVDFFSKGIHVESVNDTLLKGRLLCLPEFLGKWEKKDLMYYSHSSPRIKQRLEDMNNN